MNNKKTGAIAIHDTPVTSTEIIPQDKGIATFNAEQLISQGIEKGITVDVMERLLAMRTQLKQEWAKEQFNKAMSAFQSKCPTIKKSKNVIVNSKVVYSYAPIESIISQIKDLLQECGFSYSTSMEVLPDGVKVCVRVTHIEGHSEENCMQVPLGQKTGVMNASQQVAAAQTFAKRYAFLNAFGIMTGDEDNDGKSIEEAPQYTHGGEIIETPRQAEEVKPTEKQLKFIKDLATKKGYTMIDVAEMQKKVKRTPTQIIDYLKGCPPKMNGAYGLAKELNKTGTQEERLMQDLPVIQQEEMTEEDKALVDSVPF